jgi:hypothetical protein
VDTSVTGWLRRSGLTTAPLCRHCDGASGHPLIPYTTVCTPCVYAMTREIAQDIDEANTADQERISERLQMFTEQSVIGLASIHRLEHWGMEWGACRLCDLWRSEAA